MNNVLRLLDQRLVISHGGTENWQRKGNLVAAAKAVKVRAKPYNALDVEELYPLTKLRNIPREYHLLILNWQENSDNKAATFKLVELPHTTV